jgi:hypothetical protein
MVKGREGVNGGHQHGAAGSEDVERIEPFSESKCSQFAPPRAREVRVDGALRAARRRRVVRLVEDQHRAWIEAPEPVAEGRVFRWRWPQAAFEARAWCKRLVARLSDANVMATLAPFFALDLCAWDGCVNFRRSGSELAPSAEGPPIRGEPVHSTALITLCAKASSPRWNASWRFITSSDRPRCLASTRSARPMSAKGWSGAARSASRRPA